MKTTKKTVSTKSANKVASKGKGKTDIVLQMVEAHKTRKDILDKLVSMDPDVSRKSNAGLVSHILKNHDLLGKVDSGVERVQKKKVTVKATAKKKVAKKVTKK